MRRFPFFARGLRLPRGFLTAALLPLLCSCSSYSGSSLKPGESTLQDVLATMGEPAARWTAPDHSMRLSYPHGPAGYQSYMVEIDAQGHVQQIRNVLDEEHFKMITRGMEGEEVLRTLGPPVPAWTAHFPARRELVWEWRYCNEDRMAARFDVLLDSDRKDVRSTASWLEDCSSGPCFCGR